MDDTTPKEAFERGKKLDHYRTLREHGVPQEIALGIIQWSRATYYRWQKRFHERGLKGLCSRSRQPHRGRQAARTRYHQQQVLHLRRQYPAWGNLPLWRMLTRDSDFKLSISSVGRILAKAVRLGRIQPCAFFYGRTKAKRRRYFTSSHAKRWKYQMKAQHPGEMIQIDHMTFFTR
ncbi:MAG: helix-turn-helix domain-containing protein [Gammaproteobacteria bacterium]|nr:helix-turn-helix domain-containing protein [Gammaproteobacteria bacterium]